MCSKRNHGTIEHAFIYVFHKQDSIIDQRPRCDEGLSRHKPPEKEEEKESPISGVTGTHFMSYQSYRYILKLAKNGQDGHDTIVV